MKPWSYVEEYQDVSDERTVSIFRIEEYPYKRGKKNNLCEGWISSGKRRKSTMLFELLSSD
jgi:hypothetical protein